MKLAVANFSIKALESCVTWHGWDKNNPCPRPRSWCYVRVLRIIRAIIIEDDSNYHTNCNYHPSISVRSLQYSVPYSELFILYYGQIAQSKGWRSGLSAAKPQAKIPPTPSSRVPIQLTKLTTDPGSTLFLRRNRKGTPTNHPSTLTTLPPYHPTTLPPPSSTRTTSSSRAYSFLITYLPLVPLLCVCFSALDPHSSKSLACVVGCCSPCRRFLQPLEPDPLISNCCFSVADTRFHRLEPEIQPLYICMIPQLCTKRERERDRERRRQRQRPREPSACLGISPPNIPHLNSIRSLSLPADPARLFLQHLLL
jgi:hypothetical protein